MALGKARPRAPQSIGSSACHQENDVTPYPALLLLMAAAPIAAQTAQTPAAAAAQRGPQPISRATFIATMDAEFRRLDANRDGNGTRAEVEANQRRIVALAASQRAAAAFARIDTDRNGQLSLAEFTRATATPVKADPGAVMNRLDANRDAKVTIVEYRTLTLTNFDRLDTDKDGMLSLAEQRAGGYGR